MPYIPGTSIYLPDGLPLSDPDFDHPSKVHDWRNHVGERTKEIWHTFTHDQQLAIAADATDRADSEEWE